jgi:hypothetical protein
MKQMNKGVFMNQQRRNLLKYSAVFGLMASAGLISEAQAQEWNKAAFEGKSLDDVFKVLNAGKPASSSACRGSGWNYQHIESRADGHFG